MKGKAEGRNAGGGLASSVFQNAAYVLLSPDNYAIKSLWLI